MTVFLTLLGLVAAAILCAVIGRVIHDCTKPLPGRQRNRRG